MARTEQWIPLLLVSLALVSGESVATTLETLVMPGPVHETHEHIETECGACHSRFSDAPSEGLCLDCHNAIRADRGAGRGYHGFDPTVREQACNTCHSDHLGRNADISSFNAMLFDHAATGYALIDGHDGLNCGACHEDGYRGATATCESCHLPEDVHEGSFGMTCSSCHTERGWVEAAFDHDATVFALRGGHEEASCSACHASAARAKLEPREAPRACVDCHRPDDVHDGRLGEDCSQCHGAEEFTNAQFKHFDETGFRLQGRHASLKCVQCHVSNRSSFELGSTCVACHSANDPHLGRNGRKCAQCHTNESWTKVGFEHERDTGFALSGAHEALACAACHKDSVETVNGGNCIDCHEAESPHGREQSQCDRCHNEREWLTGIRFDHDLTRFPLLGSHGWAACEQCHDGLAFQPTPGLECQDCHAGEDAHEDAFGSTCAGCHNPVAWSLWVFDHDQQTNFALDGGHEDLECATCHKPGTSSTPPLACGACHEGEDPHEGSFGSTCGRCHTTESFAAEHLRMRP